MKKASPTPAATSNSPVTLRLDEDHRQALDRAKELGSPSEVLRLGLRMVDESQTSVSLPLYPRLLEDPEIALAVESAARAACEVLDGLFPPGTPQESRGISSSFQGALEEQLRALLAGRVVGARRRSVTALFGDHRSLGTLRSPGPNEAYTVLQEASRYGTAEHYFDSDQGLFVELGRLTPGALFTNADAAVKAVFSWLREQDLSPRELELKLCLIHITDRGPLKLAAVAS